MKNATVQVIRPRKCNRCRRAALTHVDECAGIVQREEILLVVEELEQDLGVLELIRGVDAPQEHLELGVSYLGRVQRAEP